MLITRILKSGGGPNAQYPKWVWSYYGGWYAAPENYIRNTIITGSLIATLASIGFYYSSQIETRHSYPHFWIPSVFYINLDALEQRFPRSRVCKGLEGQVATRW